MKSKNLLLLTVLAACGLGAGYLNARILASRSPKPADSVHFLVARRNIDMGEIVHDPSEMFERKAFTGDMPPIIGIDDFRHAKGRVVKVPIRAGEALGSHDLLESSPFGGGLPIGLREIGLVMDLDRDDDGKSLPKSKVAVVVDVRSGDDTAAKSYVLLPEVVVLNVEPCYGQNMEGSLVRTHFVRLACSPEDCLRLGLASKVHRLRPVPLDEPRTYLVAKSDIARGTPMPLEALFEPKEFPIESLPKDGIVDFKELGNRLIGVELCGEPIRKRDLIDAADVGRILTQLKGYREITVRIDLGRRARVERGEITAKMRVDLLAVSQTESGETVRSTPVLRDVFVTRIDGSTCEPDCKPGYAAALAVSPDDVARLNAAMNGANRYFVVVPSTVADGNPPKEQATPK